MALTPDSERLRQALQWVKEEQAMAENRTVRALYDDVCLRFDLKPSECETLYQLLFAQPQT